ncbi:hypothetical protein K5X82_05835 [Halosquirtibacter xylanolyticus]|uniref:hypothetical protein n=1 Tax=Halosquirtibacter xylanolyticus TaxID=3374599 RepID=UPI003749CB0A|nr:hypothetical protein K5X82_05835 [Prolixibacteraceae bacterium]
MKRALSLLTMFVITCSFVMAQDLLILKDGAQIHGKILSIEETTITIKVKSSGQPVEVTYLLENVSNYKLNCVGKKRHKPKSQFATPSSYRYYFGVYGGIGSSWSTPKYSIDNGFVKRSINMTYAVSLTFYGQRNSGFALDYFGTKSSKDVTKKFNDLSFTFPQIEYNSSLDVSTHAFYLSYCYRFFNQLTKANSYIAIGAGAVRKNVTIFDSVNTYSTGGFRLGAGNYLSLSKGLCLDFGLNLFYLFPIDYKEVRIDSDVLDIMGDNEMGDFMINVYIGLVLRG